MAETTGTPNGPQATQTKANCRRNGNRGQNSQTKGIAAITSNHRKPQQAHAAETNPTPPEHTGRAKFACVVESRLSTTHNQELLIITAVDNPRARLPKQQPRQIPPTAGISTNQKTRAWQNHAALHASMPTPETLPTSHPTVPSARLHHQRPRHHRRSRRPWHLPSESPQKCEEANFQTLANFGPRESNEQVRRNRQEELRGRRCLETWIWQHGFPKESTPGDPTPAKPSDQPKPSDQSSQRSTQPATTLNQTQAIHTGDTIQNRNHPKHLRNLSNLHPTQEDRTHVEKREFWESLERQ